MKAFILAGTNSGCGKTTITLGIMAALRKKGHRVIPFKCGPDFIDPGLHTLVTGKISRNLDLWMAGRENVLATFFKHGAEEGVAVIEGVMGMYDGGLSSSASLAKELDIPVILVIDVRSMAESAAALVRGFETLTDNCKVAGVILNKIGSERHLQLVSDAIRSHCQCEIIGHLPRSLDFHIPARHLGLHMGEETPISKEAIDTLADTVSEHIDLDTLLRLADGDKKGDKTTAPIWSGATSGRPATSIRPPVHIAVARDRAFCFYYQDNFDILEDMGAKLHFFSPLTESLPKGCDALYLGGGYPELYGRQLGENSVLLQQIKDFHEAGNVIYAECGGFMYLTEGITDLQGVFHKLVGIFPTRAEMQTKRASLGYRQLTTVCDSFWGGEKTILRGHEFHYSRVEEMDDEIERIYSVSNQMGESTPQKKEGYRLADNTVGGYMHLHFGYNRDAVAHFIQYCKG